MDGARIRERLNRPVVTPKEGPMSKVHSVLALAVLGVLSAQSGAC